MIDRVAIKILWPIANAESRALLLNWLMGKIYKSSPQQGVVSFQEFIVMGVPSTEVKNAIETLKLFLKDNSDKQWARYEIIPNVDA